MIQRKKALSGSSYALCLYEYLCIYADQGESPLISVEEFRHLMGATGPTFNEFKFINARIIQHSLNIINGSDDGINPENTGTDIQAEVVTVAEKRTITHLKFIIKRRSGGALQAFVKGVAQNPLQNEMQALGFAFGPAQALIGKDPEKVRKAIDAYYETKDKRPIPNPAGYITNTFKKMCGLTVLDDSAELDDVNGIVSGRIADDIRTQRELKARADESIKAEEKVKPAWDHWNSLTLDQRELHLGEFAASLGKQAVEWDPDTGRLKRGMEKTKFMAWWPKRFAEL
jgi:hypothetical protein